MKGVIMAHRRRPKGGAEEGPEDGPEEEAEEGAGRAGEEPEVVAAVVTGAVSAARTVQLHLILLPMNGKRFFPAVRGAAPGPAPELVAEAALLRAGPDGFRVRPARPGERGPGGAGRG
ncbi:hypothetical protein GCM10009549_06580 [Streptomyces thermoalcalitolerans]|uniref:Uncharacterized protein n=1 Tax=Streptomyces thermoalcalitolerans TaxID=65605 RepID=A0ABN1NE37_9ACTN